MDGSRKSVYINLLFLILVWGLSWPISKVGLQYMHPVPYTSWRFGIALLGVIAFLLLKHKIKIPKKQDLPLIFSIGLLQMALFVVFLNFGLMYVGAGRAALLVYSTPVWVTPIAVLFFREKLKFTKITGLLFAGLGLLMLLDPFTLLSAKVDLLSGYLMLVAASLVWAGVILHTRYGQWHSTPLDLLLWQLLLASIVLVVLTLVYPVSTPTKWNITLISSLIYNGLLSTAYAYFASIIVAKALPSVTTSAAFLGVPMVGLLASVLFLREEFTVDLALGMAAVMTGLFFMALSSRKNN